MADPIASAKGRSVRKPAPAPGETAAEFRRRLERESDLEFYRDHDPSLGPAGQKLPVRYE